MIHQVNILVGLLVSRENTVYDGKLYPNAPIQYTYLLSYANFELGVTKNNIILREIVKSCHNSESLQRSRNNIFLYKLKVKFPTYLNKIPR